VLADDENLNGGEFCLDDLGYRQAIHAWHADVQQYDIRLMLSDFAHSIIPIARLANNFDIRLRTENLEDPATDALVVVYNGHTKYASSHSTPGDNVRLHHFIIRMEFRSRLRKTEQM
jgi:hypothetical protein